MAPSHDNPPLDEDTDLGTMWQDALIKYYEECGTDLRALPASHLNFHHIKAEQDKQLLLFSEYRHNKGKLDKLRSLISKNSDMVLSVAKHVATAASAAFPPSAAILTAFNYVMNASSAVSEDYDLIISFFDIMHSFLERISMLESRMPAEWQFRRFLVNVFSAMMTLSATARKCRLKGRLSKWAKALIDGSDPKLKGSFDSLHMHLQRFESAAMLTTLKYTLDSSRKLDGLGQDVKQVQIGVEKNLALSQQNYILGLESKGHAMDAAFTSHEILTVLSRQEGEYTSGLHQVIKTLNKMSSPNTTQGEVVDAGNRKSMAMRTLETLLQYNLDDKTALADIEAHYLNGTCSWLLAQGAYTDFEAGKIPLLWLSGPAGIGKSTLAYTAVKTLQKELIGDAATSVVHFFFSEDIKRRYASQMLCSCALQVASRDNSYREEAVADVQIYEKRPRDRSISPELTSDEAKMWELLFQTKFSKASGRRLVLVLDGLDEVEEKDRKHIDMILDNISGSGDDMNIQVFFTSDPASFAPDIGTTKAHILQITKELLLPDMRSVIIERLKSLSRLRKLPPGAKRKIITRLSKQADTMRYLDHLLLRLNQLGRETLILRQLNNLPSSTAELYKIIVEECQKARTDEEIAVLRRFFAWLAYSPQPLPLGCANTLLGYMADDNTISIDEEIEHRCSRILRLSNSTQDRDDEESQGGSDSDSDSKTDSGKFDNKIDQDDEYEVDDVNDCFVDLGFQEKGLRNYFRPVDNQEVDKLRSPASSAHVMILEAIRTILCTEKEGPGDYRDRILHAEATRGWRSSFQRINPAELSETETARVIESIRDILSNLGGSIRKMESQYRPWNSMDAPCVLGATDEEIQGTLDCLQTWATRATKLPPSLISDATVTWARPFAQNPRALFIKLADAHATNWLTSYSHTHDSEIYHSFLFAHYALYQGRDLPVVQDNEQLRNYFASSKGSINNDSVVTVSRAFPHIDMTAQSYLSVAVSMTHDQQELMSERSLLQLDLALQHADTDIECMEIYMKMTEVRAELARLEEFTIKETEYGDQDAANKDKRKTAVQKRDQWTTEALEAITKAADIALNLPEKVMEGEKVQDVVCSIWMFKAKVELLKGDSTNIIAYCRQAVRSCGERVIFKHFEILRPLGDAKDWTMFLEVIKVLQTDGLAKPWVFLNWYMDEIHNAAKATGEVEFVLEQYRDAFPPGSDIHESDVALLIGWARFYRDVVGTGEATAKAKALLNRAIDARESTRYVAEASFRLSDILLEEFRHSSKPKDKTAAYNDMQDLVERVGESMGAEFDPSQSQTVIPLAHMARKMNALEFQQGLEKTFAGCVAALTDETGWNDKLSLRVLARVLALVGLERDAEIAATCQIYILNMDVFRQENGLGDIPPDDGDAEESERSGEDDYSSGEENAEESDGKAGEEKSDKGEDDEAESNDVSPDSRTVSMSPQSEEGGEHHEDDEAGSNEGSDSGGESLRDLDDRSVICTGCELYIGAWGYTPVYLCYYCTEINLCQMCFDKRAERIAGKPSDEWQVLCPEGHKHIRMPVEGWDGLEDGVFKIEGKDVSFQDWLLELKEKKWPAAWDMFWSGEQ